MTNSRPTESIYGLTREELVQACEEAGEPKYRAGQIWSWLYEKYITEWEEMRNVPARLREALSHRFDLFTSRVVETEGASDETQKLLVQVADRSRIETVLIPSGDRSTVCLSTQVGCKFACRFCASGQGGYVRNLSAGEIVSEIITVCRLLGHRPSHVVYMGMGEPLDNYDNVMKSVRILNDPTGLGIGARRITISTAGVIPGIERLANEGIQFELSVSLHAPDHNLRSELMPINKRYPLSDLISACSAYTEKTKRIITFEYTLIDSFNDSISQARALAVLLQDLPCRINLIPLSPVDEFSGKAPSSNRVRKFAQILEEYRINVTVRHSQGTKISAACGQLRLRSSAKD